LLVIFAYTGTQFTIQQLGKTVQTIATMTQNQGTDPAKKTNLIGKIPDNLDAG
jgi:hypothetical protein